VRVAGQSRLQVWVGRVRESAGLVGRPARDGICFLRGCIEGELRREARPGRFEFVGVVETAYDPFAMVLGAPRPPGMGIPFAVIGCTGPICSPVLRWPPLGADGFLLARPGGQMGEYWGSGTLVAGPRAPDLLRRLGSLFRSRDTLPPTAHTTVGWDALWTRPQSRGGLPQWERMFEGLVVIPLGGVRPLRGCPGGLSSWASFRAIKPECSAAGSKSFDFGPQIAHPGAEKRSPYAGPES